MRDTMEFSELLWRIGFDIMCVSKYSMGIYGVYPGIPLYYLLWLQTWFDIMCTSSINMYQNSRINWLGLKGRGPSPKDQNQRDHPRGEAVPKDFDEACGEIEYISIHVLTIQNSNLIFCSILRAQYPSIKSWMNCSLWLKLDTALPQDWPVWEEGPLLGWSCSENHEPVPGIDLQVFPKFSQT